MLLMVCSGNTLGWMADKTYLVRLKVTSFALQQVTAARCEIQGEHVVFIDSRGRLAGLFLMELVESWSEVSSHR